MCGINKKIFLFFLISLQSYAVTLDIITDPSISARCKNSLTQRSKKLELKQKANFLVRRSEKIQKIIPKEKKSVSKKISFILKQLHQEIKILDLQITNMEEEIIRQGCPGIVL